MRNKTSFNCFIITLSLFLFGCTQTQLEHSVMSYNKAISEYGNQEILLNAVRASKRHPLYFSHLSSIQGQPAVTGQLAGDFSFSPFKLLGYSVNPSASIKPGFGNASISALDTEQFNKAILNPVDTQIILNNFLKKGWPMEVVLFMFVQSVKIPEGNAAPLSDNVKYICMGNSYDQDVEDMRKYCPLFQETQQYCDDPRAKTRKEKGVTFRIWKNDPEDQCEFLKFRDLVLSLKMSEATFAIVAGKKKGNKVSKIVKTTKQGVYLDTGEQINYTEKRFEQEPRARDQLLNVKIYDWKNKDHKLLNKKGQESKIGVNVVIRSPDGLIYYTGEIIRAQTRPGPKRYSPKIMTSEGALVDLFKVKQGFGALENSAVSVSHMGESFSIPPTKIEGNSHRSMQVLTLIKQVFDLNTKNEDLPQNPVLTLPVSG